MPSETPKRCDAKGCAHWALTGSRYCAQHGGRAEALRWAQGQLDSPLSPLEALEKELERASSALAIWELAVKTLGEADADAA
jgi:hypothetical protein